MPESWIMSLVGGALIGLSATLLLLFNGRVAGISGIVAGLFSPADRSWRAAFVGGLLAGGALLFWLRPESFGKGPLVGLPMVAVAGLLVGYGTRNANGCTSGHGVCGLARLSPRSLAATLAFMGAGAVTVLALRLSGVLS